MNEELPQHTLREREIDLEQQNVAHEPSLENYKKDVEEGIEVTSQFVLNSVREIYTINQQLSEDIIQITAENNNFFTQVKLLKNEYNKVSASFREAEEIYKELTNQVTTVRIECNRVNSEMQFLKGEQFKLEEWINEKSMKLGQLIKRVEAIKQNYRFLTGEFAISEDILESLETLTEHAFDQKKKVGNKILSSEGHLDKLVEELNSTIKESKSLFYKKLN